MIPFLNIAGTVLALVVGLIFISITIAWFKKHDKDYKTIEIDNWRNMKLINVELKKRKEILEREIIKILLYEEELEDTLESY
jgi:hypothetical protein